MDTSATLLRQKAEASVRMPEIDVASLSELEIKEIIHHLEVHRIELELQNEELQRANVELGQAKSKYANLFEFAPVGYLTLDRQGRILEANRTFVQLVGAPGERIAAAAFTDFIAPDFQDTLHFAMSRLRKTLEKQHVELQLKHVGDYTLWAHVEMTSLNGGQTYLVSVHDVTPQKQAEQRYKLLSGVTSEGILVHSNGIIRDVNASCSRMTGYSGEEFIGKNLFDMLASPEDRDKATRHVLEHDIAPYTVQITRQDGTLFDAEFEARNIDYHNEEVRIVAIRDVTERKQAEEALRQSEERFRAVWETTADALLLSDAEGIVLEANPAYLDLYGYSRDNVVGKSFSVTFPEAQRQWAVERNRAVFEAPGVPPAFELEIRRPDGTTRMVESRIRFLYEDEQRCAILSSIRDVTERKHAENALKEALAEKEVLLQEIHHRVKNNMQTIAGLLYKQQQHVHDDRTRSILQDSIQRVKSMALIHEQIYRSRSLARINLAEYIRNFASKLFQTYRQYSQDIVLHVQADDVYLSIDRSIPVALILNELITNALKYAFPDNRSGEIRVECRREASEIALIVADTGIGFPENFDITHTNTLGLYLVYNLTVKQLGGLIDIHSLKGTTEFTIRFQT